MHTKLKNSLIIAGLLSIMSIPSAKADDRLIMTGPMDLSTGLSNITTTDAGNGGAILNNAGYMLNLTGGTFSNNILQSSNGAVFGGALYQTGGMVSIADGVRFDGNTVRSVDQSYPGWAGVDSASGGALYINSAQAILGDVIFNNNKALSILPATESNGGAIFVQSSRGDMYMGNVTFTNNSSATRGGAIYNGDSSIIMRSGTFNDNQSGSGGAIYSLDVTGRTQTNTGIGTTFENNKATLKNGGAIANYDGTIEVGNNNSFNNNNAVKDGGAIYNSNWMGEAKTTVNGGTSFTGNSAERGAAIYNSGKLFLDTASGNITFSNNSASTAGSDIYLDGASSQVIVSNINAFNKVIFNSTDNGSIAGSGTFTNSSRSTVEFIGNKNVNAFTGKYVQEEGTISLNNSNMFNKYDIRFGNLEITNGSTATVDGIDRKLLGTETGRGVGVTIRDANSVLNITDGATILKDSGVFLYGGGKINIDNGTLTLNANPPIRSVGGDDTWQGDISTSTDGNLTLDGFTHSTASGGGNYTQSGGSLNLNNGSNLTLGNADSKIEGGTVNIGSGNSMTVQGGSVVGGTTQTNVGGNLNIGDGGAITGGTTNVQNGGNVEINSGGSVTGGTTNVNSGGNVNVNYGGSISGNANTTISSGGKVTVDGGSIDSTGKTDIQTGSELEIKNGGDVNLNAGDNWQGTITNNNSDLTLNGIKHDTANGQYVQTGGNLNLVDNSSLTLGQNSSITNGNVNIEDSNFEIKEGGSVTGGEIIVGDNSSFNVGEGGIMSGGKVEFVGNNVNIGIDGTILADAVFDVVNNTVNVGSTGNITLNKDVATGDLWTDGTIKLGGGTLNYEGLNNTAGVTNGKFLGNSGKLNITSTTNSFTVAADSYIKAAVETTIDTGSSLDITGGDVALNDNDTWKGNVNLSDGNLTLDNVSKDAGGVFNQTGGNTTISGDFAMNNSNDSISGGIIDIGEAGTVGNLNQTAGTIGEDASVNIASGSKLNIQGGTTTLNSSGNGVDNWFGSIQQGGGTLNLNNVNNNGKLESDGGNLNITGNSEVLINSGSFIKDDTVLNLDINNKITISNNGTVNFTDNDTWNGDINLNNGGTLNYSSTTGQGGNLVAQGGNLNTAAGSMITIKENSVIEEAVNVNIAGMLSIRGSDIDNQGQVSLSSGDVVTGNVAIGDYGVLNLGDNVKMADSGQKIEFSGDNAEMNLNTSSNLDLKAELVGNAGEINKNGEGNILFSGGTSNYKGNLTINESGNLIFTDADGFGGNLLFGDIDGEKIGIIADKIKGAINQDRDAEITYSTYNDVALNFGDTVDVSAGSLIAVAREGQDINFADEVTITEGASVIADGSKNVNFLGNIFAKGKTTRDASDGKATVAASGESVVMQDVKAENAIIVTNAQTSTMQNISLNNSTLQIAQQGFTANAIDVIGNSDISLMNGVISNGVINNDMAIQDGGQANVSIDISARDWQSDKIIAAGITTNGVGTLNVSDFQFINKCPIDRHVALKIFDTANPMENILFTATDKEIFTPIGYYKMFSQGGGNYTASLTRYNPQVFRGQVATVASYQNQLVVNNILFDHMQEVNMQYLAQKDPNKYAATYPQFAPYQYNKKDGSLWFKSFGTFERLGMTQGLNVNNNFYGAMVGADFSAIELGKGWSLLPTAYVAYTGGHQTYANTSMYQNGGQGGAMATFMKNDFIGSLLAYGGGFGNNMDVAGHTDSTGTWFVGTAAKAAYNFHPSKHFVIQPTALVSYNLFGEQNWYTGFGAMNMQSGMLNGINVAPGVNFIYGRDTWSVYATVQYFYNIMGYSEGQAGNVNLPGISMRHGFLEYGLGFTKTFKERLSAYVQVVLRNGGRTGVGFQGGLMYRL